MSWWNKIHKRPQRGMLWGCGTFPAKDGLKQGDISGGSFPSSKEQVFIETDTVE